MILGLLWIVLFRRRSILVIWGLVLIHLTIDIGFSGVNSMHASVSIFQPKSFRFLLIISASIGACVLACKSSRVEPI